MTRVKAYLRVMWWRHGRGAQGRYVTVVFKHGMHAGYHMGRGEQTGCDERCERLIAQAARV